MADRNRTDLDRDADLYKQFIAAKRELYSRNANVDRSDREDYNRRIVEKEDSTTLETLAKIAGLGVSAYALGRTVPKDVWVTALHKMGQYGRASFGRSVQARNKAMQKMLDQRGIVTEGRRTAPGVELSDFIEKQANPLLRDTHNALIDRDARAFAMNEVRTKLQKDFANESTERLTGLTVGDVLKLSKTPHFDEFKVISEKSIKTLQEFRAKVDPNGSWFDHLVVDKHLYKAKHGALNKGIKTGNDILDTRWASRRALGENLYNGLGFQIPYVGFKPVDLFTPFFRLAGKRKTFQRLGQDQVLAEGVKTPSNGVSFLINGEITHFDYRGVKKIAPGRKFRAQVIDGIGEANLARLGRHPLQKIKPNKDSFVQNLQSAVGFGPMYRQEPQVAARIGYRSKIVKGLRDETIEWKPRTHLRMVDLPMSERARLERKAGQALPDDKLIKNPYSTLDSLPKIERQKAMVGSSTAGDFIHKRTGKSVKGDKGAFNIQNRRAQPIDFGSYVDEMGKRHAINMSIMEDTVGAKLNTIAHFAGTRLNDLIGATLGIGFRPSQGRYGAFWNFMKVAAIGATFNPMNGYIVEAAKYVNYMFERITSGFGYIGDGIGIDDIAIKAYEGITLGAAGVKDVLGITAGAQYLEDLFPGSIESPLSGVVRTLAPTIYGMRGGPVGMFAGLAAATLAGGVSDVFGTNVAGAGLTTSSSDLLDLYNGDKKERVRNSRWWMMGRQSFYGEGTDRFAPHWVKLAKSDYQYTSTLYGSKGEYFSQASRLPTFHNLFGFGGDEDYYAKKHAQSRPYVEAPSGASYSAPMGPSALQTGPGLSNLLGAGYQPPTLGMYPVGSQTDISYKLASGLGDATELLGIYKFFGELVFNKPEYGPVYSNASEITSINRMYWDKDLGGLFGMTELLRRFITPPNDVGAVENINTIPNQMPSFLPGSRSAFVNDRSYYKDFTVGDPYTAIKEGEYRLPGAAYESVNELHSGEKGVYDAVDAFMILSDVAPYSQAYHHYERAVSQMQLSEEWRTRVAEAQLNRNIKARGISEDFRTRRFTNGALDQVNQLNEQIKYNALEKFVGAQYERATMDMLPEVGRMIPFGTLITHKLFPHHTAEQDYLERQVYNSRYSNWQNPYEGFIRPKALTLYNENPFTATAGGAMIGLMGSTPGARAVLATAGALGLGVASAGRAAYYGRMEGGYKPGFREQEEKVLDYFDKLEYLRLERAANRATLMGNMQAASQYKNLQSKNTMVGLDYTNSAALVASRRALPRNEKPYLDSFINAAPQDRARILEMSPEYMQNIYRNIWERGSVELDKNAAMAEFMMNNKVPDEGWGGWNPGVEKWQIMSRTMDTADNSIAIDLHRQNISTAMMAQTSMRLPNIGVDLGSSLNMESREWHAATDAKLEMEREARANGFDEVKVAAMPIGGAEAYPRSSWRIKRNKEAEIQAMINEALR